ncbi:MAG: TonB-dependent receptor [Pyrinomonadaceae bacterium]|nr:TonB-dependent receptor [Pyrinomonadaceae bacterium]
MRWPILSINKPEFRHFFLIVISLSFIFCTTVSIEAQQQAATIAGEVKDELGALIIGARVSLKGENADDRSSVTNELGRFEFNNLVADSRYEIRVTATGFADHKAAIAANTTGRTALSIVLYPTILENVSVEKSDSDVLDPESLAGTLVISQKKLEDLPDDPDELNTELQNLAASSGSAPGSAIVTVDGFLNEGRLPSKSAIREVRVNPNLFSAEYNFPPFRGGRIEITTKPGSGPLTGSAFINFNDDILNARNAFATTRANTQTKRYGFQLGAPIRKDRAGFFVDFEKRDLDESAAVNAATLDDAFDPTSFKANIPNPKRLAIGSVRGDLQADKNHSLVFRYIFNSNTASNQGIGGTDLPSRAVDYRQTEHVFRVSETAVVNTKTVNEFRIGLTLRDTNQNAAENGPIIRVAGAFTSGGADLEESRLEETDLEISNNLITEVGSHILKIGTQIFNFRTRDLRRENQNGSFFFGGTEIVEGGKPIFISGLEQYRRTNLDLPGGVPTQFSVNLGEPIVSTSQWLFAAFVQDEWRLNKKLLVSLGLRAESQTLPKDRIRFAPRVSIAYSPDKKRIWAFRARAGIFYQRIGDALLLTAGRLDGVKQQRILIEDPGYPDPFSGGALVTPISVRRVLDPNLKAPGSLQMRVEIQRKFPQGWSMSSSYSWTSGWSQFRSRNINAPAVSEANADPLTAPRPFGTHKNILQFESAGKLRGKVLYIGVNQNTYKLFSINAGYLNFDFKTDAHGAFVFPQSSYELTGEFSPPVWHSRHRMFFSSRVNLPWSLRLSASINAASGIPLNVTTGQDNNGDGIFNDRPEITTSADPRALETDFGFLNPNVVNGNLRRNVGTNPANFTVSMNIGKTFVLRKQKERHYSLTANVRVSNLLNRVNRNGLTGVLNSPFFGRAFSAGPARRIEFGLRFSF